MNTRDGMYSRFWSNRVSVSSNLLLCDRIVARGNEVLDQFGNGWKIDEIAVLADTHAVARGLCAEAVSENDVEMFNSAVDVVYVTPFGTNYDVQYHFLRTGRGYRVEVMSLGHEHRQIANGFSPVHAAMWHSGQEEPGDFPIVHVSFKCADLPEFLEAERLLKLNGTHAASCSSNYGRFSYWLPAGTDEKVLLKPRINVRDSKMVQQRVGGGVVLTEGELDQIRILGGQRFRLDGSVA